MIGQQDNAKKYANKGRRSITLLTVEVISSETPFK